MSSDDGYSDDAFEDEGKSPSKAAAAGEKYSDDEFEEDFEEEAAPARGGAEKKEEQKEQKEQELSHGQTSSLGNVSGGSIGGNGGNGGNSGIGSSDGCSSSSSSSGPSGDNAGALGGGTQWAHVHPEDIDVGQRIGGGGFAIVYEGRWEGRHVALKTLFDPRVSQELIQEFMDELHVMSALCHPNVVELFAANTRPPKLVIVMELCDRSLYQLLHQTKEPVDEVLGMRMATDVAAGLAYLHAQDPPIIHRDIKSMNLLLTVDKTIKLCDFGLVTTKVTAAGTPAYMAPELLRSRPFSKKVDVYAFAIILWEIFQREVPWTGYAPMEVRSMVLEGARPDVPRIDCPYMARGLMTRCWDPDPTNRPEFREVEREMREWTPPVNHLAMLDSGHGDALDAMFK
jgi:tRNA A-37 threonylcarbamoyl transferase component Bud32